MALGIGRRSIGGQPGIARRPIATASGARSTQTAATSPQQFPPGSYTFTPTVSGWWKFVAWGGGEGGSGVTGGGSGGYCEITKFLTTGQTVAVVVGKGFDASSSATSSTATFPDGTVATAGAASGATGGTASGGDVNLNGSAGGNGGAGAAGLGTGGGAAGTGSGGGAGAPANLPFRGGDGASTTVRQARSPGAGAAINPGGDNRNNGGDGLIIAFLARS